MFVGQYEQWDGMIPVPLSSEVQFYKNFITAAVVGALGTPGCLPGAWLGALQAAGL